jgi:two-component system nitrate/nitrite response regulator NarL
MSLDRLTAVSAVSASVAGLAAAAPATEVITIVVADAQILFRQALARLLATQPGIRVVAEAGDGEDVLRVVHRLRPAVVLIDHNLPGLSALETLAQLTALERPPHVLMVTSRANDAEDLEALRLGARGVIAKDATAELLFKSIRMVVAGQYWVGRDSVAGLIQRMRHRDTEAAAPFGLTVRELELVDAVAAGCANNDIAAQLKISPKTVKHHLTRIFAKLRVSNRLELALFAVQHQLGSRRSH